MPGYKPQDLTLPLLHYLAQGGRPYRREWSTAVAEALHLGPNEVQNEMVSGGTFFQNYCSWAWIHLHKARLVDGRAGGPTWITERGLELLRTNSGLTRIDGAILNQFPEYSAWTKHWAPEPHEFGPTADHLEFEAKVTALLRDGAPTHPPGVEKPEKVTVPMER